MKEQRNKSDLKKVLALLFAVSSTTLQTVHATDPSGEVAGVPPIFLGFGEFEDEAEPNMPILLSSAPSPLVGDEHSSSPTKFMSLSPTASPSSDPSSEPTARPSYEPTASPSYEPTMKPSEIPSTSVVPSTLPTQEPTRIPSTSPTVFPSLLPTLNPDLQPSSIPSTSSQPTKIPTQVPTTTPSVEPTSSPSLEPTLAPSTMPSFKPSGAPSMTPTLTPSARPSDQPSDFPSNSPSVTNVESYSTKVVVELDSFSVAMDENEKVTFQNTVKAFIAKNIASTDDIGIKITGVQVVKQFKSEGAKNGMLTFDDVKKTGGVRALEKTGLLVEMIITGDVSFGTIPKNFSFGSGVTPGLVNNFDQLLKELDESFSVYNAIRNGDSNGEGGDKDEPSLSKNLVMYLSLGSGFGGLILAAGLFLVHKRKKESRLRVLQSQSEFAHSQSSLNDFESIREIKNDNQWNWVDPNETNIKKDLENPYGDIQHAYSVYSNPPQGVPSFQSSDLVSSMYFHHVNFLSEPCQNSSIFLRQSVSDQDTPTGSASTSSMGINLSPKALHEAQKQHQTFSFVPQNAHSAAISHSYPDQNGRLVYKSYVCSAPPGPLGIIIDTTAEGPMVHAIKPTSQLLGSIAPGDIVVGLDNIETRQMTAPALTRLMARKSQQANRKITLLRPMSS